MLPLPSLVYEGGSNLRPSTARCPYWMTVVPLIPTIPEIDGTLPYLQHLMGWAPPYQKGLRAYLAPGYHSQAYSFLEGYEVPPQHPEWFWPAIRRRRYRDYSILSLDPDPSPWSPGSECA
ncbi:hypothetical protein C0993_004465, partial [Termitomyces sp. T159_Od127]